MVDPLLFRERTFSTAVAIGPCSTACTGPSSAWPSTCTAPRDRCAAHGLALLPMTVVTGTMAFLSGRLVSRVGEWRAIVVGLAAGAQGAADLARGARVPRRC
jgi:hypothetical protein